MNDTINRTFDSFLLTWVIYKFSLVYNAIGYFRIIFKLTPNLGLNKISLLNAKLFANFKAIV